MARSRIFIGAAGVGIGLAVGYCLPKMHVLVGIAKPLEDLLTPLVPKPSLRLRYFNFSGRGEQVRWALAAGKVPFVDEHVTSEAWPSLKASSKSGALPDLSVGGIGTFCQSEAILRYAGRLGGTYPTDPVRALAVDEVLGMNAEVIDLANLPGHASIFLPGDPAKYTATAGKMISEKKLPALLQTWEHMLAKNGSGYFVGREPTIADFAVASTIDMLRTGFYESCHSISPKVVDGFPRLNALVDLIKDIPGVHRYREEKQ